MQQFNLIYREGYLKALVDVRQWITRHTNILKAFRINNAAGITAFLDCAVENQDTFMGEAETMEFLVTKDKKRILFEYPREEKQV